MDIAISAKRGLQVAVSLVVLLLCFSSNIAGAASVSFNITAKSDGGGGGQGSFSPSTIPVNQNDSVTITFTVPSSDVDVYCCGIQVKGDGGQFDTGTISPGASKQVSFIAGSSFGFTSYWPASGTVKAHGSVNVTPTPAPTPVPTTQTSAPSSTTTAKPAEKPAPTNTTTATPESTDASKSEESSNSVQGASAKDSANNANTSKKSSSKLPFILTIGGLGVIGLGSLALWKFYVKPKSSIASTATQVTPEPSNVPPDNNQPPKPN